MDINEIRQYPHKITKINITNSNDTNKSDYDTAMFKITINDKNDNEIIVFSTDTELMNVIPSKKNQNDYYISIANKQGVSVIYAHYLMADLYDYEEDESDNDIFFSYDLKDLNKVIKQNIDYHMNESDKPKIASLIQTANNEDGQEEKDPNYKHYLENDSEQKGPNRKEPHFPLSSRYNNNGHKKLFAPTINQTPDAHWATTNTNYKDLPVWEARIPREDLKIVKQDTDEVNPINVYLNYQYLPTSTKYHEHFFGFEDMPTTQCRNINVLDGDDLDIVNEDFGEKGTYRLINIHNKKDQSKKMYIKHNTEEVISINEPIIHNDTCTFKKNICDNYYIYTPIADNDDFGLHIDLSLKKDTDYILKYYMWVPTNVYSERDEFGIKVGYTKDFNEELIIIGQLPEKFRIQDRFLNQQWIYHEIPFTTVQAHNELFIQGPKYEEDKDKQIFFSDFILEEIVPYSPTIKYTNKGVFVMEDTAEPINKPNKQHKYPANQPYNPNNDSIYPEDDRCIEQFGNNDKGKDIEQIDLPTPHTHIYIDFDDNFDINYSERTGLLTYISSNCIIKYDNNTDLKYTSDNYNGECPYEIQENEECKYVRFSYAPIEYDETTQEYTGGDLVVNYELKKLFTRGINNSFTLKFYNEDAARLDRGYVECCITTAQDGPCIKELGKKYVDANGVAYYNQLNFSRLSEDEYYLKITYYHPCYEEPIVELRKIHLIDENAKMTLTANGETIDNHKFTIQSADDFPLKINAHIVADVVGNIITDGYCELSIDDDVKYTTMVDNYGNADFYLNYNTDNLANGISIKITYYRKKIDGKGGYFEVLDWDYFVLEIPNNFNTKDPVPIRTRVLINDIEAQNSKYIEIDDDDCLLIDLDTSDTKYINYSIRLYKGENGYEKIDNENNFINITSNSKNSVLIWDFFKDTDTELRESTIIEYTIVTDNKIDNIINDEITYLNDKYRPYKETFKVKWKHKEA